MSSVRLAIGFRMGAYLCGFEIETVVRRSDLLMEESVVSFGDGIESDYSKRLPVE